MQEFEAGMEMLHFTHDAKDIFRLLDRAETGFVTLNEIDHFSSDLWRSFQTWCAQSFECAEEMVASLGTTLIVDKLHRRRDAFVPPKDKPDALSREFSGRAISRASVSHLSGRAGESFLFQEQSFNKKLFIENSVRLGWYNSSESILFKALDINNAGVVVANDIAWFDKQRKAHLRRNTSTVRDAHMKTRVQGMRSKQSFVAFLKRQYGCIFRAWRVLFDEDGSMVVTRKDFFAACRSISWRGDLVALWHTLDNDDNGHTTLEELAPREACVLARFKQWMISNFGEAKAFMRALNTVDGGHTKLSRSGRFTKDLWIGACKKKRCPINFHFVFDMLDFEGQGSVMLKNLKFLDRWHINTEWLLVQPSPKIARELKDLLHYRYNQSVKAWVRVFDRTHSGKVTWTDFKAALEHINFKGNAAAAWAALDDDVSGYLTLKEFDAAAATQIATFRCWCDDEFGGVVPAMEALDADESGTITFREFRDGVKKHGFNGEDLQHLFHSLDIDEKGKFKPCDLAFLDEWELAEILDAEDLHDFTESEVETSSDEIAEDTEEDEEDKEHSMTCVDAQIPQKSMPRQSLRSSQPWPRINRNERPPSPSGMRSKLLAGAGALIEKRVLKQTPPLHIEIMAALKSRKAHGGKTSTQPTSAIPDTPDTGKCPIAFRELTASDLLHTIGWKATGRKSPHDHPSVAGR